MSRFVKIDDIYINVDLVTDFYYSEQQKLTKLAILGEKSYRSFLGNYTSTLLDGSLK